MDIENLLILSKDGKTVYGVKDKTVVQIAIPNGVTDIGWNAFRCCTSLESVDIPNSVTTIGLKAFEGCTSLKNIAIPNSVTYIGHCAFNGCTSLERIVIANSLVSIESEAFDGTKWYENQPQGLVYINNVLYKVKGEIREKTITIRERTVTISPEAFMGCMNIKSIYIPNSVKNIGRHAFLDCASIKSINIPNSVTNIESGTFAGCSSLKSIDIPSSVTTIGTHAFGGCISLESIEIPNSVTGIRRKAFEGCTSLRSINLPKGMTYISSFLGGCISLESIYIPNSVTSIGSNAFDETKWYDNQPSGLVYINDVLYKVKGEIKEKSITIREGTVSINQKALKGCASLESIDIPNSVTDIGSGAFSGCTSLESIDIPNSVTSIGRCTFEGCISIKSIDIPDSVTSIEAGAFKGCTSLESIDIPNSVSRIDEETFRGCSSLRSIDLPDSIISIGPSAFKESGLEKAYIPCFVDNIGEQAFCGAPIDEFIVAEFNKSFFSLDGVLFDKRIDWTILDWIPIRDSKDIFCRLFNYPPANKSSKYIVTKETIVLCSCAFKGASYLEELILHDNVSAFEGEQTFCDCTSLKEIRIPSRLKYLPTACFEGCESLEHIYLPNRKKLKIEKRAFKRCPSLIGIHSRIDNPENIDISEDAFEDDTFNLCTLYIPSGTRWAYRHHPILGKFRNIEIEKEQ